MKAGIIVAIAAVISVQNLTAGTLNPGQLLNSGDAVSSSDGRYYVTLQADGNLVAYRAQDQMPLWSSGTAGHLGATAIMQVDGNFVVRNAALQPVWHSGTTGRGAAYFTVTNEGRAAIVTVVPTWSSKTSDGSSGRPELPALFGALSQIPMDGRSFYQNNGLYRLAFQTDGNLVLYKSGRVAFKTNTQKKGVTHVTISRSQIYLMRGTDGASYVSTYDGKPDYWQGSGFLAFQTDGNLVMYTPKMIWGAETYDKPAWGGAPGGDNPICVGSPAACIPPFTPIISWP